MKLPNESLGVISLKNVNSSRTVQLYVFGWRSWVILALALVAQLLSFDSHINLYDEGIILVGADSIFSGKLPYKDFWTMYGPGQFYLVSWLFKIFEPADVVVRAIGITAKSIVVMFVYVMIDRFANGLFALAGAVIALGMLISLLHQDAFPIFPAMAFAMAAALLLEEGLTSRRSKCLVAAGLCTGAASCFRHDLGAYSALASGLSIAIIHLTANPRTVVAKQIGYYMMGILSVTVPIAALLLYAVPLTDLYENLLFIPSRIYPSVRSLPFPGIDQLMSLLRRPDEISTFSVYVPYIACAASLIVEFAKIKELKANGNFSQGFLETGCFFIFLTALTCLLFTLKGLVRISPIHMTQSLVLAVILILVSLWRINWSNRLHKVTALLMLLPAIGLILLSSLTGFTAIKNGTKELLTSETNLITRCISPVLPRMRCVSADGDYLRAADFVRSHTNIGDKIYVGVGRHDKIFINAVAFYFMVERQPATKWYELHPGIQTQARVQAEMIAEMETSSPRLVILDWRWDGVEEPNASRVSSGEHSLDRYLESKYVEVSRFGTIRVLAQR